MGKHGDAMRTQSSQHEKKFVRAKLHALASTIAELLPEFENGHMNSSIDSLQLDFAQFLQLMEDHRVKAVLHDLDVDVYDAVGLFETFDSNGDGPVNLSEFMHAIMKLRGEPQKNDMIATWTSIRTLQDKVDHFQSVLFENQEVMREMMKANLSQLMKVLDQAKQGAKPTQQQVAKQNHNNRPTLYV